MTDEQYIEKLVNDGFEQKEINQLLKIYVYTKKHDFILENIDVNIDTDTLRKIADFVKNENLSPEYYSNLKNGQELDCNIIPYLLEKYSIGALSALIELEYEGRNIEILQNPKFSKQQINMLSHFLEKGVKGIEEHCLNPEYSLEKMSKILSGLMFDVILEEYINLEDFDQEQCGSIAQAIRQAELDPYLVNLDVIIDNTLTAKKMLEILDLMVENKPYWLLLNNNYSEIFCNILYNSIKKNEKLDLIEKYLSEKNNFNSKQANSILEIILSDEFDESKYDYKKIFNKNNNYLKIAMYQEMIKTNNIDFLNKIIDFDYNVSQIIDLFKLHKMGINIDEIKEKNDAAILHLYRREKELESIGKSIDNYLKKPKAENKKENKKPKFEIGSCRMMNKFFEMSDGGYLEVFEYYDDWHDDIMGYVYDECPNFEDEISTLKDIIIETFKNTFVINVDEVNETIDIYNIFEKATVQEHVDHYAFKSYFVDVLFDETQLYSDLFDATVEYFDCYDIVINNDTPFATLFDSIEDLIEFIPTFNDKIKIFIFGDMSETLYYVVTEEDIIKKYGKIDDEITRMAEKEFKKTCECLEAYEECEVYSCRKYDKDFNLIDSKDEYYGPSLIDDIEQDFGTIKSDLGNFSDLKEFKLIRNIELER